MQGKESAPLYRKWEMWGLSPMLKFWEHGSYLPERHPIPNEKTFQTFWQKAYQVFKRIYIHFEDRRKYTFSKGNNLRKKEGREIFPYFQHGGLSLFFLICIVLTSSRYLTLPARLFWISSALHLLSFLLKSMDGVQRIHEHPETVFECVLMYKGFIALSIFIFCVVKKFLYMFSHLLEFFATS